jgi:3'(2'), 5'-bisphosphate nucleotidase
MVAQFRKKWSLATQSHVVQGETVSRQMNGTSIGEHEHEFAARIASEAGRLLLTIRLHDLDPDELRVEGDRRSHDFLVSSLADEFPGDAWLSEEAPPESSRLTAPRVWIIDPLDGTREFGEAGRTDWAVHVALVVDGEPVVGAVALPAERLTLCAHRPPAVPPRTGERIRRAVSATRPSPLVLSLAERLDADLVPMGSAGAKIAAVVRGEVDIYAHSGGQYEWDSAAPVAVARAAGLHASRIDGSPLRYNQQNPWLPDLLVCRPELAADLLRALREV